MRLTCPNCGAQYEVPDEVIPPEGRDVQCSACGNTWFQAHPDQVEADEQLAAEPDLASGPGPEPEPESRADAPATDPEAKFEPEPDPTPADPVEDTRRSRGLDPEIAGILKEEAEREAALRASEAGGHLETQPDLGLDDTQDEASRRARQARERMARLRGADGPPEEPPATAQPHPEPGVGSRRDMLPDIDEINSTLRNGSSGRAGNRGDVASAPDTPRKKGGFSRGFMVAVILGLAALVLYMNAGRLAQGVPQAEPALTAYVGAVDQARLWLDAQLGALVPRQGLWTFILMR